MADETRNRPNWRLLIRELDLTDAAIARACNCDRSTIAHLRSGRTAQPRHDIGEALIELHREKSEVEAAGVAFRR